MSLNNLFTDKVQSMQAYNVQSSSGMIKLDAMEMPFLLPEEMKKALAATLMHTNINRYPNPKSSSLVRAIREGFDISNDLSMMLGNGSDELIQIILTALSRTNAVVMSPVPSFVMYQQVTELLGMDFVGVDYNSDFTLDENAFLSEIELNNPAVIFLSYPNNPTSNLLPKAFVEKVLQKSNGFVVIDEAYGSFSTETAVDLLNKYENALLIRTFSKIGFAGLRIGYMLGSPSIMKEFEKVRMPYNIDVLSQATMRFMLEQSLYINESISAVKIEKDNLYSWLDSQEKIEVFPSETNFLLIRVDNSTNVFEKLRDDYQILIKNMHGYHSIMNNILRITVGTEKENKKLMVALDEILRDL